MTWEIIPLTFELPSVQQTWLWRRLWLGLELDRDPVYLYTNLQSKHIYTRRVQQYILFSPSDRSHFVPSATWLLSTLQPFLKHCDMENVKGRNKNCHHSCFECCCGTLSRTFILSLKILPIFSPFFLFQASNKQKASVVWLWFYYICILLVLLQLLLYYSDYYMMFPPSLTQFWITILKGERIMLRMNPWILILAKVHVMQKTLRKRESSWWYTLYKQVRQPEDEIHNNNPLFVEM